MVWTTRRVCSSIRSSVSSSRFPTHADPPPSAIVLGLPPTAISSTTEFVVGSITATEFPSRTSGAGLRGGESALSRIDPVTNRATTLRRNVMWIEYGEGSLWLIAWAESNRLEQVDPRTNRLVRSIDLSRLSGVGPRAVAVGYGAVWTARLIGPTVWRIDPETGFVSGSVTLPRPIVAAAIAPDALWLGAADGTVMRVDSARERVTQEIMLGVNVDLSVSRMAFGANAVWVATLTRCQAPPCEVPAPLPTSGDARA